MLEVQKSHVGNFTQGQQGTYSLVVSNKAFGTDSNGTVIVSEELPAGLTLLSMNGAGWDCGKDAGPNACTRGDSLVSGKSYPEIDVIVRVSPDAGSPLINQAHLSGGGDISDHTDSDRTLIAAPSGTLLPILSITKTHTQDFQPGQQGQYTVVVSNDSAAGPTTGTVNVTETLPPGLTLVSMTSTDGTWNCSPGGVTCTHNDALAPGASYAPITVTALVAPDAASPQVNQVTVSGGGSASSSTASDSTGISAAPVVALTVTPATATVPAGATVQLSAHAQRGDGSSFDATAQATWSSSDGPVASVNAGTVAGLSPSAQPVTITASFQGVSGQAQVTVTPVSVIRIAVEPDPATVTLGSTIQLAATAIFSDGTEQPATTTVNWASSAPSVASVNNRTDHEGEVTGLQTTVQPVTVTATDPSTNVSGSTQVTVTPRANFGAFLQYVTIAFDGSGLADHGAAPGLFAVDAQGRFVAFTSYSTNLLGTKPRNSLDNVYLRDLACVPPGCVPTRLQSVTPAGDEPAGTNLFAGLTRDGSIVGFISGAPNISDKGDEVFEITGSNPSTVKAQSVDAAQALLDNTQCGATCGQEASISSTGRFTVFITSDPVLFEPNVFPQAYVHDSCLGVPVSTPPTCVVGNLLLSRAGLGTPLSTGVEGIGGGLSTLTVSADGRFATFFSGDTELGGPPDQEVLWLLDAQSPALTPTVASVDPNGVAVTGVAVSMSDDGRYISFEGLDPVTNMSMVYLRDLSVGGTTVVASNATCSSHGLSSNGRYVAFISGSNPLNLPDLPLGEYVYVADMIAQQVHLVSVDSSGKPVQAIGAGGSVSGDGTRVVYSVLNQADNTAQLVVALTGF